MESPLLHLFLHCCSFGIACFCSPAVPPNACTGRVGSAFAAELGTMAVSEQTDSLRVLGSDPVDYLVTPRVLACMIAAPILNLMCFAMGAPLSRATCRAAHCQQQPVCVAGRAPEAMCEWSCELA